MFLASDKNIKSERGDDASPKEYKEKKLKESNQSSHAS